MTAEAIPLQIFTRQQCLSGTIHACVEIRPFCPTAGQLVILSAGDEALQKEVRPDPEIRPITASTPQDTGSTGQTNIQEAGVFR